MSWIDQVWGKWSRWEFWPAWLFQLPVLAMWFYFALRARNGLFFIRVNPSIPTGGLFGESKWQIMKCLPEAIFPKTIYCPTKDGDRQTISEELQNARISFPLIIKPDVGERGFLVKKCVDEDQLRQHLDQFPEVTFLIQEYVDYPEEYSLLYHRFPGAREGRITSLCQKRFLQVTGDGNTAVRDLLNQELRGRLQLDRLTKEQPVLMSYIPAKGENVFPEPIGNHCRGTTFLDAGHHISLDLTNVFDLISHQSKGLYYGRFDLRCRSMGDLEQGEHFKVLEYNGVASEPAHIYHPGRSIRLAYRDIYDHWRIIYALSKSIGKEEAPNMKFSQFCKIGMEWMKQKKAKKAISSVF